MSEIKTINLGDVTLAYKEFGTGDKYLISTQNFFLTDCHMELLGKPPYDYTPSWCICGLCQSTHITDPTPKDYISIWGEDIIRFAEAMNIPSFYYTGVSTATGPAGTSPSAVLSCCGALCAWTALVHYQEPGAQNHRPPKAPQDLDNIVGNYEALEKMAWMENWPTQNPQRLPAGLPTTKNIPRS